MNERVLIGLIPLLPFAGFLLIGFFRKHLSERQVSLLGCAGPFLAFLASARVVWQLHQQEATHFVSQVYQWIAVGGLHVNIAFYFDPLSGILCLVITGVGSVIHFYSIGYMHGDKSYGRYFAYLNLFTSMMLVLVLGANLPLMFVGWEGVGLCSYLLIGFWYGDMEKSLAAQKAFIVNRVGDGAFLMGVFYCFYLFGTLNFQGVNGAIGMAEPWQLMVVGLFFFIGACGKSAQLPLYVWLPDAMAGPTPVSALIHAATMVTAGVYMIGRLSPLYSTAPYVGDIVALVGVLTAFFAGLIAITQRDIKKVLAYSTISQLGYMFLAMGLGAYSLGIFHLTTHAFFKALLFLGSGAVIHSFITKDNPHGEQDIYKMGGLWNRIPIVFVAFIAGGFSLSALPPFCGFYSKDPILARCLDSAYRNHSYFYAGLWALALITAFLTVIYTFRLIALTFFGTPRGKVVYEKNPHPSFTMGASLLILSVLSIVGGFALEHPLKEFLSSVWLPSARNVSISHKAHFINMAITLSVCFSLAGVIFWAFVAYFKQIRAFVNRNPLAWFLYFASYQKFFVDEIYGMLIINPLKKTAHLLLKWVDLFLIEGLVNGVPRMFRQIGCAFSEAQSGRINQYALLILGGTLILLGYIGYNIMFLI